MVRRLAVLGLVLLVPSCGGSDDDPAAASSSAPAPEGCVDDASPGHHAYTCDEIVFDVEVPARCTAGSCGLIFDVHGFSMSAEMQDASTQMRKRGREKGYVVVQPNANPRPPLSSWDKGGGNDEVVFQMLQRAMRVWHIDPKRVHMSGFSQGGNMTWRMLCKHAETFASVAPAAFDGGCTFEGGDAPSREVPTLYMHGSEDGLVPFAGALAQRDRVVAAWKMDAATQIAGDASFVRTRHVSPSGTPVEFLTHGYVVKEKCLVLDIKGHCFPGSTDPGTAMGQACSFACPPPSGFDWGAEVMAFFEAHPQKLGRVARTVTSLVPQTVSDGSCSARMLLVPREAATYIAQYDFFEAGKCSLRCLEQQPDGELSPCK